MFRFRRTPIPQDKPREAPAPSPADACRAIQKAREAFAAHEGEIVQRASSNCDLGASCGRYNGKIRQFDLVWDRAAQAYRRVFEPEGSRVVWNEARAYSTREVAELTRTG